MSPGRLRGGARDACLQDGAMPMCVRVYVHMCHMYMCMCMCAMRICAIWAMCMCMCACRTVSTGSLRPYSTRYTSPPARKASNEPYDRREKTTRWGSFGDGGSLHRAGEEGALRVSHGA